MCLKPGTFKCACAIDSITNQYHTVFNDYYYCMCRKLINNVFSFVVTATRLRTEDCVHCYADMLWRKVLLRLILPRTFMRINVHYLVFIC